MQFSDEVSYHEETKHSYFSVRSLPNRLDWDNQPSAFKVYPKEFQETILNLDIPSHAFLYYIASIDAKKSYPGVEYYLRINPSAGALYPNEIYFQSRNNEGIVDGIYHLNIAHNSISLLQALKEDEGIEPLLNCSCVDGFILLNSALYYRSAWKYKNRALRYCLLDSGHLLGCIENSAYIHNRNYEILYEFNKERLNQLFGFNQEEFFLSATIVGMQREQNITELKMQLPYVDGTQQFEANELIEKAYQTTLHMHDAKECKAKPIFNYQKEIFKEKILQRRSIREFSKQAISQEQLESILSVLEQPITSDCDEVVDIYYVVNRVKGLPLGLYKEAKCIKQGDFCSKAGYLCLEQELGASSAVTFFLTTKSKNYQAAYQKAGIIGQRLYLSSNYLQIGCSGIGAYYDNEVCEFLEEQTQVLYALAIGN